MGVDFQGCPDELQIRGPDSAMMVKFCPWLTVGVDVCISAS